MNHQTLPSPAAGRRRAVRFERASAAARPVLIGLLCCLAPANACADWLLTPFIGTTFGVRTAYITLDNTAPAATHWTFGGNGAWLSDQVFGVEADLAFAPGFFEGDNADQLVTGSSVTTFFGNVIAATPLSLTRESLRPYLLGGLGVVRVSIEDPLNFVDADDNSLGLQLGGGAMGFIGARAGLRFDLRYVRTLRRQTTVLADRQTKLSFWRAAVGVVFRY